MSCVCVYLCFINGEGDVFIFFVVCGSKFGSRVIMFIFFLVLNIGDVVFKGRGEI